MHAKDPKICSTRHRNLLLYVCELSPYSRLLTELLVLVLLLLLGMVIHIIIKRRRSEANQEYNVEAGQVEGPPTIISTQYHPTSGPSRVYNSGSNEQGNKDHFTERELTAVSRPAPSYQSERPPTYTAPVSQVTFSDQPYPFAYNPVSLSCLPCVGF